MTLLLLDTTLLIDLERGAGVAAEFEDSDDVAVAAITVAELRVGALLASGRKRALRSAYVDDVVATLPVLPYDRQVAEVHAELLAAVRRAGRPRGAHDLIIAATARATGRMVVTADERGFADLPSVRYRTAR